MRVVLGIVATTLVAAGCGRSDRAKDSPEFVVESPGGVATAGWSSTAVLGYIRAAGGVLAGDGDAAAQRAQDTLLREFGQRLTREQRALSARADSLAGALGMDVSRPSDSEFLETHERAARDLQGLSGAEFDRRFLDHVTEALGRAAARLDDAATTGGSGPAAELLQEARTTTRRELDDAQRLRQGLRPV